MFYWHADIPASSEEQRAASWEYHLLLWCCWIWACSPWRCLGTNTDKHTTSEFFDWPVEMLSQVMMFDLCLWTSYQMCLFLGWQVIQQPAGTYTPQEHLLRVGPLFAEPILAFLLYYVILGAMHLWDKRDKGRVETLSKKLRKMVSDLKVRRASILHQLRSTLSARALGCN